MKISHTDLKQLRESNAARRLVFCDGTYDLLHLAHTEHLKSVSSYGDILIVGVMSDEWVVAHKGSKRPILSHDERAGIVGAIKGVNYAFALYDEVNHRRVRTTEALALLRPNVYVTTDAKWGEKADFFNSLGIELYVVPPVRSSTQMTTTKIIERILELNAA
jgi:cytidyltransferase-like protein